MKNKNKYLKRKGTIFFFIVLILCFVLFYLVNLEIQKRNFAKFVMSDVNKIKTDFENLKKFDTKMLSSNLNVVVNDPMIKRMYLEKDREKLYDYVNPLFEELKEKYGITHWYFILPEGNTFLRVHDKDIYGDEITRFTFYMSRDYEVVSSGIELGKTAYALRVVMPYYDDDTLIGYVELGEEIDHFLDILGGGTEDEFFLAADKKYLDKEKWKSVREVAGLRNNWEDSKDYIIISPVALEEQDLILNCFTEKNLEEGMKGKVVFQEVKNDGKFFRCAGIPLTDAGERPSGMILSLINVSSYKSFIKSSNLTIAGFLVLIFLLMVLMSYFMFKKGGVKK